MTDVIEEGATEIRGDARVLRFLVRLPQAVENVWPVLATAEGLRRWLDAVEAFEPRLGGAVTLAGLGPGQVTAWDVERVAEYSVEGRGRVRFHLEPAPGGGTTLRFIHEIPAAVEPPDWRVRLERLVALPAG